MADSHYNAAQLVLPVRDMKESRDWYEALGFETVWVNRDESDPEGNFATLVRDGARIMLIRSEREEYGHPWEQPGNGYLFLLVKGVEGVYKAVRGRGVATDTGLVPQPWGPPGFHLTDPSGNLVLVAEDVSGE